MVVETSFAVPLYFFQFSIQLSFHKFQKFTNNPKIDRFNENFQEYSTKKRLTLLMELCGNVLYLYFQDISYGVCFRTLLNDSAKTTARKPAKNLQAEDQNL